MIKIIAWNMEVILNEREILNKSASCSNIDVLWLMSHKKFNIQSYLNTIYDLIF